MALKPLIKWPGGKESELTYILPNSPHNINNYYEPFVGGGSVFTAINANHYYVNDLSNELTYMYHSIADLNADFFECLNHIEEAWNNAHTYFLQHRTLVELYLSYRNNQISKDELKTSIKNFCNNNQTDIFGIIGDTFEIHRNTLISEFNKNLFRKMSRMKVLEEEKHQLPDSDLDDNIETAIKSALYMYFRYLYNDKSIEQNNPSLYGALFFFIRNYCYSGMFRYNDKGEFNVPYGGIAYNAKSMQKKIDYYQSNELQDRLNNVTIENLDFEAFLDNHELNENDFVFLDPPYDTEFSTYAQNEFSRDDQQRLANLMINRCNARWMLIIKNTDFIYNLYNHPGIYINTFDKQYLVSFMNRNDRNVEHLLITNYPLAPNNGQLF